MGASGIHRLFRSSCVLSLPFSFSVSFFILSPSRSPCPQIHSRLISQILLTYKHAYFIFNYTTVSLFNLTICFSTTSQDLNAFWDWSCTLTSELLFKMYAKIYQFHWQFIPRNLVQTFAIQQRKDRVKGCLGLW